MSPEQKEAFRREALEEAAKVAEFLQDAWLAAGIRALAANQYAFIVHPDDKAVDRFAAAMKVKLAKKRDEGRGGWWDNAYCNNRELSAMLREHVDKGDPLDVGNLAMMLHQRGERIAPAADTGQVVAWITEANAKKLAQSKKPLQLWVFPHDPSQISGTPYVALAPAALRQKEGK